MIKRLIDRYRVWSAQKDMASAFKSLTLSTLYGNLGTTMVFDGKYSIAVFTSNPDYTDRIRAIVEPVFKEEQQNGE